MIHLGPIVTNRLIMLNCLSKLKKAHKKEAYVTSN